MSNDSVHGFDLYILLCAKMIEFFSPIVDDMFHDFCPTTKHLLGNSLEKLDLDDFGVELSTYAPISRHFSVMNASKKSKSFTELCSMKIHTIKFHHSQICQFYVTVRISDFVFFNFSDIGIHTTKYLFNC